MGARPRCILVSDTECGVLGAALLLEVSKYVTLIIPIQSCCFLFVCLFVRLFIYFSVLADFGSVISN